MKNIKLSNGSVKSQVLSILGGCNTYGNGAFLTDGTPIVVMNHGGKDVSYDGWLVRFVGGTEGFRHCVHPFESSHHAYAHAVYERVSKLEVTEMSPAVQYFTGQNVKIKFSLINPSAKLSAMLAKWCTDSGYERTCHSDTCSCASHDSGYDWEEFEMPIAVLEYLDKWNKIRHGAGNVHSHESHGWGLVPCERDLCNRDERAAEECQRIIEIAQETTKILRQLRLVNRNQMFIAVWELAGAACKEVVENAVRPEEYFKLIRCQQEFMSRLDEQIVADRQVERDSFLAPEQWAGLDALSLA